MAFNDVIPNFIINEILEEIRKEPKQLHFDEDVFFPCFYIDIKNVVSCNEAFQYVKASGGGKSGTISKAVDHPAFAALREHLGREGFIEIERGWWNGDRVIKPFYLNDVFFDTGKKFVSADAMKYTLESKRVW